jgi:hypothetical protein
MPKETVSHARESLCQRKQSVVLARLDLMAIREHVCYKRWI